MSHNVYFVIINGSCL